MKSSMLKPPVFVILEMTFELDTHTVTAFAAPYKRLAILRTNPRGEPNTETVTDPVTGLFTGITSCCTGSLYLRGWTGCYIPAGWKGKRGGKRKRTSRREERWIPKIFMEQKRYGEQYPPPHFLTSLSLFSLLLPLGVYLRVCMSIHIYMCVLSHVTAFVIVPVCICAVITICTMRWSSTGPTFVDIAEVEIHSGNAVAVPICRQCGVREVNALMTVTDVDPVTATFVRTADVGLGPSNLEDTRKKYSKLENFRAWKKIAFEKGKKRVRCEKEKEGCPPSKTCMFESKK